MKPVNETDIPAEFSPIEWEMIALKALTDALDSMLNHSVMTLRGNDPNTEIVFDSSVHQRLFTILLVDFLAKPEKAIVGFDGSYLELLSGICHSPSAGEPKSIMALATSVEHLSSWLSSKIEVTVWLPSLYKETNVTIQRSDFIWITGNISKHNFARLTRVSRKLIKIFQANDVEFNLHQAITVLDEFYERFHDDILNYHSSALAEILNNVRWGIHNYLEPLFKDSFMSDPDDPIQYEYQYPQGLNHEFARSCFWDVMNEVRRGPNIRPFKAPWYLKKRY